MPEGDTVHKLAVVLARELEGRALVRVVVRGVYGSERLARSKIERVQALGKHTLFYFERDVVLRVHLGMKGTWHRYLPGAPWKRSSGSAVVVLETEQTVCVCFQAMDIEMLPRPQLRRHKVLSSLGPDLLSDEEPDWDEVAHRVGRFHTDADTLGEVLLDQRIVAGIGNVYKSELAFMGPLEDDAFKFNADGYDPWRTLSRLKKDTVVGFFRRARTLLQANLGGWHRTTTVDRRTEPEPALGALHVYGRAGKKCPRCGAKIAVAHQGLQHRVTYWCAGCQR